MQIGDKFGIFLTDFGSAYKALSLLCLNTLQSNFTDVDNLYCNNDTGYLSRYRELKNLDLKNVIQKIKKKQYQCLHITIQNFVSIADCVEVFLVN